LSVARPAASAALLAVGGIALAGFMAGAVRVLPWVLDPAVPLRAAIPFARGLAAVGIESALLVGWPLGWTVAFLRIVESGEARVLQTLGQGPAATVMRLAPQGAAFALASALVGVAWGRDAGAPGSVANDLIAQARASCQTARSPVVYSVPFTGLTWLCAPDRGPRLVGSVPAAVGTGAFSAADAKIAGDFRSLELHDARLLFAAPTTPTAAPAVRARVSLLSIRGLAPWAQASTLPAPLRGLVLSLSGVAGAFLGAYMVLRGVARSRIEAFVLGAAGPLAALGIMRWLERMGSRPLLFVLVPIGGGGITLLAGALVERLRAASRVAST
jgi:hypothetical protein